jgi:hypothetical protein
MRAYPDRRGRVCHARRRGRPDHPDDVHCPDCGRNMGHSKGNMGLLAMHRKWSHQEKFTDAEFLKAFGFK